MKLRAIVLLAPLLLAAPRGARADAALDEARALTGQATVEYNLGRFQQALELYTKAYERLSKPALLFNIGQCHRLLGHYEQALFFYHGYLREQPDAPNRSLAEQHIEESERALDAQRAAQQESQRQAAQANAHAAAVPMASASAGPSAAPTEPAGTPVTPVAHEPWPSPHAMPLFRITGLVTAGVGVLLFGTGVALGVHANSLSGEVSQVSTQHGTWTAAYQSDYNSGKSDATAATVLYIVGATAIATGAVLTWLGWPKAHPPVSAAFAPLPGGGGSLAMAGSF
jgi:tetratricopeptide (TPR) repeat protein